MDDATTIRTPYEEMHRSFIIRLLELKDKRGYLREASSFLRCFAGMHSGIHKWQMLEAPYSNMLRVRFALEPIIILNNGQEQTRNQSDWIIDFLFCDSVRNIKDILGYLSTIEFDDQPTKHALIHFGCSPYSYSWDIAHAAFMMQTSHYDSFHSISPYEMANYLSFDDRFFEVYAGIISGYAKSKAIANWQRDSQAFYYFCSHVVAEALEKKLGRNVIVNVNESTPRGVRVSVSLPDYEWQFGELVKPINAIHGLTLNIHFLSGEPVAHLGLSFHCKESYISDDEELEMIKAFYKESFFQKYNLGKSGFYWAKESVNPAVDEFAYAFKPLWIYNPWEIEQPEMRLDCSAQEQCATFIDDIADIIKSI